MKHHLSASEQSLKAATKRELPTDIEISSAEDIHLKTWEASKNIEVDIREFLGIYKSLQTLQGKLVNNTSKLKKIDKRIKKCSKNF